MRLCATSCTLYTGGVSSANELMLLHLLLYHENEKQGLNDKGLPSEGNMKQGGRDAPNDLLDKLLTGTLVAFELCLPSTSSQTNLHSESEFSTSAPTQASSISSTKEGKDREEMRCVAFRSLCNLSDCDSADALGNPFDPFDITYPNIIQSLFGQSAFSLISPSNPNAILSYIKPNQALCEPYSVYTLSQISSYPKPILLLLHPNLPTTLDPNLPITLHQSPIYQVFSIYGRMY